MCFLLFFFFFQAEDGIRDFHVTGVQTCALPIYGCRAGPAGAWPAGLPPPSRRRVEGRSVDLAWRYCNAEPLIKAKAACPKAHVKIGRASCRERVEIEMEAV